MLDFNRPVTKVLHCHTCGDATFATYNIHNHVEFMSKVRAETIACECGGVLREEAKAESLIVSPHANQNKNAGIIQAAR